MALLFGFFATAEIGARSVYKPETHHCSTDWEMCAVHITWCTYIYGVTVAVMTFCYVFVFRAIRQSQNRLQMYGKTHSKRPVTDREASINTTLRKLDSSLLENEASCSNVHLRSFHAISEGNCKDSFDEDNESCATTRTPSTKHQQVDNCHHAERSPGVPVSGYEPESHNHVFYLTDEVEKIKRKAAQKRRMKLKKLSNDKRVALTGKYL